MTDICVSQIKFYQHFVVAIARFDIESHLITCVDNYRQNVPHTILKYRIGIEKTDAPKSSKKKQ